MEPVLDTSMTCVELPMYESLLILLLITMSSLKTTANTVAPRGDQGSAPGVSTLTALVLRTHVMKMASDRCGCMTVRQRNVLLLVVAFMVVCHGKTTH